MEGTSQHWSQDESTSCLQTNQRWRISYVWFDLMTMFEVGTTKAKGACLGYCSTSQITMGILYFAPWSMRMC